MMNRDSRITPTGFTQEVRDKHHAQGTVIDKPTPGRHEWVVLAVFSVQNPARAQHLMDRETLISVEGPGCVHCEQQWTPTLGSKCPGEPRSLTERAHFVHPPKEAS